MTSNINNKTSLNICKAFLFFFISTYTLRIIFSSVYFKQLGLTSFHTGTLQGASFIAKAFGAFAFGYVADRANLRKVIFLTSVFACAATPFLLTLPQPKEQHCIHYSLRSSHVQLPSKNNSNTTSFTTGNDAFIKSVKKRSTPYSNEQTYSYNINDTVISTHSKAFHRLLEFVQRTLQKQKIDEIHLDHDKGRRKTNWKQSKLTAHHIDSSRSKSHKDKLPELQTDTHDNKTSHQRKVQINLAFDNEMTTLFAVLLGIIIIGDFISGPAVNLTDTAIMHLLEDDKEEYGKVRLWSNVGQMILIPSVAVVVYFQQIKMCGVLFDNYIISLYIVSAGMAVAFLVGFKVQMPSSIQLSPHTSDEKERTSLQEFLKNFLSPLANWSLLVNAFFFGVFISVFQTFLFWTMIDLDPSQASLSVGVANFCRNISSMISFYVSTKLLRYVSAHTMISISHILFVISFIITAFFRNPWLAIIPDSLIYVAFAFSMTACVMHVGKTAAESWSATGQAFLQVLYSGIGPGVGPLVAGILMEHFGQIWTYLLFAGLTVLVLAFSLAVQLILKFTENQYQPVPNKHIDE